MQDLLLRAKHLRTEAKLSLEAHPEYASALEREPGGGRENLGYAKAAARVPFGVSARNVAIFSEKLFYVLHFSGGLNGRPCGDAGAAHAANSDASETHPGQSGEEADPAGAGARHPGTVARAAAPPRAICPRRMVDDRP